jgi:Flp pilus assembly protein CpaB
VNRRNLYFTVFIVAALVAGGAYLYAQPRIDVVTAASDISPNVKITDAMLSTRKVAPGDVPANAARSVADVVGKYSSATIRSGADIDTRNLETVPGAQVYNFGAAVPDGQVAFGLPVDPSQALGGAIVPGAKVDVIAVPNSVKNSSVSLGGSTATAKPTVAPAPAASASAPAPAPTAAPSTDWPPQAGLPVDSQATILCHGCVVLGVRTIDGQPLAAATPNTNSVTRVVPKLGTVIVAIPKDAEQAFATAAVNSTFYLALVE